MTTPKMVIVPQHKLEELEIARKRLYDLLKPQMGNLDVQSTEDFRFIVQIQEITKPMWEIANTKWEEAK